MNKTSGATSNIGNNMGMQASLNFGMSEGQSVTGSHLKESTLSSRELEYTNLEHETYQKVFQQQNTCIQCQVLLEEAGMQFSF